MSKLSPQQFKDYLMQIRRLAEGPLEEIQKEVEVTNKFPQEFYDLAIENDLYRCALPEEYGGYGLSELEILQVQEEFSRGPGGMRMPARFPDKRCNHLSHIWTVLLHVLFRSILPSPSSRTDFETPAVMQSELVL